MEIARSMAGAAATEPNINIFLSTGALLDSGCLSEQRTCTRRTGTKDQDQKKSAFLVNHRLSSKSSSHRRFASLLFPSARSRQLTTSSVWPTPIQACFAAENKYYIVQRRSAVILPPPAHAPVYGTLHRAKLNFY